MLEENPDETLPDFILEELLKVTQVIELSK